MIRVVLLLNAVEAKALRALCRAWRFDDAQYLLRNTPNVKPDSLCEAITKVREALDAADDSPRSP
jgi:hypothetical protein